MQRRRFGRTGFEISHFTLGGGIVGGVLIKPEEEVRLEALKRVVAAGCNWVDTAADYGQGESERALGRLLPELPVKPHISTKVRVDPDDSRDYASQIRASLETSLERLKLDSVALFQLHNQIGDATGDKRLAKAEILKPGGVADCLDKLREEGLTHAIGFTALGETPAMMDVVRSGRFDTAQLYYNMLNPTADRPVAEAWGGQDFAGLLAAMKAEDMGVMNIRVLAAGVLATDERHGREILVTRDTALAEEEARARRLFAVLGDRYGTRAQTALRFAQAHPDLSTIVVGVADLAQLDEALAAFAMGPLPAEAMAEIEAAYAAGISG